MKKKNLVKELLVLAWILLLSTSVVWAQNAPVEKTGQTTCYDTIGNVINCSGTGQDGDYQKGVARPTPRFNDNLDGTVTDNLTGLIWAQNANLFGQLTWADTITACENLSLGLGCGCSDCSDWRLPNVKELQSLIDFSNYDPALPSGHPFTDVQSSYYWSSTTDAYGTVSALGVSMGNGHVDSYYKPFPYYVWPVRGSVITTTTTTTISP